MHYWSLSYLYSITEEYKMFHFVSGMTILPGGYHIQKNLCMSYTCSEIFLALQGKWISNTCLLNNQIKSVSVDAWLEGVFLLGKSSSLKILLHPFFFWKQFFLTLTSHLMGFFLITFSISTIHSLINAWNCRINNIEMYTLLGLPALCTCTSSRIRSLFQKPF